MRVLYGLIGKKLSHSFSQKYFYEKFKCLNLKDCDYQLWELDTLSYIKNFIQQKENVRGFNITVPYKNEILKYVDIMTEDVHEIQASNCVYIKNRQWIAYNTDWWGFMKMIEPHLEPHHSQALILGTGGAARAVAYALLRLQIPFIFVSRNPNLSHSLPASCIQYENLVSECFDEYPIVINTTPLGMYPDINNMPDIPIDCINEKNFVIDLIYNPSFTLLLQEAKKRKAKTLNGLDMLYLQAEKSWEIWNT